MIERNTDLVKEILKREKYINIAVDMTAGNGYDSKFILDELGPNKLLAFDIQEDARKSTESLLKDKANFEFILDSHENIDQYIKGEVDLVVYNLGYLPKGDKTITTKWESTINSLKKSMSLLSKKGKIILTVYPGHPEGKKESEELDKFLADIDSKEFTVLELSYKNKPNNPPYICVIGRR